MHRASSSPRPRQRAQRIVQRNGDRTGQRNANGVAQRHHAEGEIPPGFGQLFGHAVERVHVCTTAEQTLPEDDRKDDPNRWHEPEDHLAQENHDVDGLEDGHQPDLVDGDDVDR